MLDGAYLSGRVIDYKNSARINRTRNDVGECEREKKL